MSDSAGNAALRLLIVEDDVLFAEQLAREMGRRGFDTLVAHDLASARAMLDRSRFDRAILDYNLPDGTGLDLLADLRIANAACRALILSGYGTLESAVAAIREGASDYLVKPADIDEIEAVLRGLDPAGILDACCMRQPNEIRWAHIQAILRETNGNLRRTAEALDLHRRTLQRILRDRRGQPGR